MMAHYTIIAFKILKVRAPWSEAVGSFPAVKLAAAAVTVETVIVADLEVAAIVAVFAAVAVGPPVAIAAVALELTSKLHYYLIS